MIHLSAVKQPQVGSPPAGKPLWKQILICLLAAIGLAIVLIVGLAIALRPRAPVQLPLGDGRTLQIEGVTYGVEHQMGGDSPLKRFRPWLPGVVARFSALDRDANHIVLERPGLVVWVNAVDSADQTNVDCQGIRMEFVDQNGDLFGAETSSWFGGQSFWRVGHVFYCYPRDECDLTLRVTTWKEGKTSVAKILNPNPIKPAEWAGGPVTQSKSVGKFEMRLASLTLRTNGQGRKAYYETAARYFQPVVEVFENGKPAGGWSEPEWFAESPNGNRGQFLGVHQPALQFVTTVYPEATNARAVQLIATLPRTDISALSTNQWWNSTNSYGSHTVEVLGLFLRGTHSFSEGVYQNSSATVNGPHGGAPSGWTGMTQQVTPFRTKETHNHYTPGPVIYLRVKSSAPRASQLDHESRSLADGSERLALRLRDDRGLYWLAEPENPVDGIHPFLIKLPSEVTNIVPELVLLKPMKAEFLINTKDIVVP